MPKIVSLTLPASTDLHLRGFGEVRPQFKERSRKRPRASGGSELSASFNITTFGDCRSVGAKNRRLPYLDSEGRIPESGGAMSEKRFPQGARSAIWICSHKDKEGHRSTKDSPPRRDGAVNERPIAQGANISPRSPTSLPSLPCSFTQQGRNIRIRRKGRQLSEAASDRQRDISGTLNLPRIVHSQT